MKEACRMFRHPSDKLKSRDRVKLKGLRGEGLYVFQMYGVYLLFLKLNGIASGVLLADEMGFGKVCFSYHQILFDCSRFHRTNVFCQTKTVLSFFLCRILLLQNSKDVDDARAKGKYHRHLLAGTKKNPQPANATCPTQHKWALACACVDAHCTSKFAALGGFTLAWVPSRLIGVWRRQWAMWIDEDDPQLQPKLRIVHHTIRDEAALTKDEARKNLWCDPDNSKDLPKPIAVSYFVVTTTQSYSRLKTYFEPEQAVRIPSQKRYMLWIGAQINDEFHEAKSADTSAMMQIKGLTGQNPDCETVFMSGTPWSNSPKELQGVLQAFEVASCKWERDYHPWSEDDRLMRAMPMEFNNLCKAYERLAKKDPRVVDDKEARNISGAVAKILEAIMVRRTQDSKWFDGPIVDMPPHDVEEREVPFPTKYKDIMLKSGQEALRRAAQDVRAPTAPGQQTKVTVRSWFMYNYQQRAIAAVPGFARLLQLYPEMSFTWQSLLDNKWLERGQEENDPYTKHLDMLMEDFPKLDEIVKDIRALKPMDSPVLDADGHRQYDEKGQLITEKVRGKAVVFGSIPTCVRVIATVCSSSLSAHIFEFQGQMFVTVRRLIGI